MTHFGSGICSYSSRITGAIFCDTRPAIIIRSDWRGDGRNTSAPNRAISKRDAPIDIISMAQQARPNVMGQMEFFRTQFTTLSSEARITPSYCCSPNVARNTCARSSSDPARLPNRSAPVSGFSNLGIRVPEFIVALYPFRSMRRPAQTNPRQTRFSRHHNHLPKLFATREILMSSGRLAERKRTVHHRLQLSSEHVLQHLVQLAHRTHVAAVKR